MKFDTLRGIWKATTEITDKLPDEPEEEIPEQEEDPEYIPGELNPPKKIKGKCILSIRFEDQYDYSKWLEYNPGRQWEFIVNYPAVMRAEYEFKSSLDVDVMAKKIVQLLSMGFDVHSAAWKLEEKEESSCGKTEE